jgi:hypothetical protein
MRRIETYELIERYLLGRSKPGEEAEIEARIKSDPSFAGEVEQHRNMQQVIHDHSVLDVKEIFTRIRNQKQISIRRRNKFYRSMLIVGSCAIIVSLSLLYLFNNNDGAVRRASEAPEVPEASEAFTDTLAPATETGVTAAETEAPEESIQKNNEVQTPGTISSPDLPHNAVPDLPHNAVPDLQSGTDSLASSDLPHNAVPDLPHNAVPDLPQNAVPDLQSGTDSLASSDLQSEASFPCAIKASYITYPSCNNKATGVIRIIESSIITGTPPYQAILNGEYGDSLVFRRLKPGFYRLEIKDASGCLADLGTIIVDTKECRYQENFYAPLVLWEIPLDLQPGTIEIYNKNGMIVYRLRFDGTGPEYWNGNDLNNEALPLGLYLFTIRYDSGEIFHGSVTINR